MPATQPSRKRKERGGGVVFPRWGSFRDGCDRYVRFREEDSEARTDSHGEGCEGLSLPTWRGPLNTEPKAESRWRDLFLGAVNVIDQRRGGRGSELGHIGIGVGLRNVFRVIPSLG